MLSRLAVLLVESRHGLAEQRHCPLGVEVLVGRHVFYRFRYVAILSVVHIKADKFGGAPSLKATGALRLDRKVVLKRR